MELVNKPLFSYFGNKDNEISIIKDNLPDMETVDVIIDPYCGSFALIRYLIGVYPNKKHICNDNDEMLIKVFKSLQDNTNCERIVKFFRTFEINDKEDYDKFKKENSIESYLFTHIIYNIRHGIYNKDKHKLNEKDLQKIIN